MCGSDLYNKYGRLITISVEFYACGDCTYLRKQYLRYLGDHLPAEITDLRNIGVVFKSIEYMRQFALSTILVRLSLHNRYYVN